ncbi:MAG: family 10 glycosylhydrolase [Planctomycetota bacterium]
MRAGLATLALCLLTACPADAAAAPDEVRGTWLTTTGPNHIRTGNVAEASMAAVKGVGLNTVYVETWKNGYTNYPSQTLAATTQGVDRSPFLGFNRDLVEETLIQAHRNGLNYIGWWEYGFSSQFVGNGGDPNNPLSLFMRNRGWLLRDQNQQFTNASNGFAWMNPAVPQVRQFLIDLTLEAVNNYDLDGIQFDDRLAWPREFGWDPLTQSLYQNQTGNPAPTSVSDPAFAQWRQDQVTLFATELYQAVKAARPDLHVSVSPSITGFSQSNFNADWPEWQQQGLFDEFVPQAYRSSFSAFDSIIDAQIDPFEPNDLDQVVVGLRSNGTGANTPVSDLQQMIVESRSQGAAGHSIFYSKAVIDDYPTQLTSFYDVAGQGPAANPNFGAGHRPLPEVASNVGGDDWQVSVSDPGHYRIVARTGTYWEELGRTALTAGSFVLDVPGALEVELLVDRRPVGDPTADFDGDGDVDENDLITWQTNAGSFEGGGAYLTHGDGDRDGDVDLADLLLLQRSYSGALPATISVPEPSAAWLAFASLAAGLRRRASSTAS